jgi:hypothetical protein
MNFLDALLKNQPIPWHPALRVAALDAAFIKMYSHSNALIGQFHDVVVIDNGEYGVSADVMCIEKNAD